MRIHSIGKPGLSPLVHIQYENRHFTNFMKKYSEVTSTLRKLDLWFSPNRLLLHSSAEAI